MASTGLPPEPSSSRSGGSLTYATRVMMKREQRLGILLRGLLLFLLALVRLLSIHLVLRPLPPLPFLLLFHCRNRVFLRSHERFGSFRSPPICNFLLLLWHHVSNQRYDYADPAHLFFPTLGFLRLLLMRFEEILSRFQLQIDL